MISIEDLVVDHWLNFWRHFNNDVKREQFQIRMDMWLSSKANRKAQPVSSMLGCNIL